MFLAINFSVINSLVAQPSLEELPVPQAHLLPSFLVQWQDTNEVGNYFAQIEQTPLGYLVWTKFPVKVYVEADKSTEDSAARQRRQQWTATVRQAIAEWQNYFPLLEIATPEQADIVILRQRPEQEIKLDPQTGLFDISPAAAGETTYEFYLTPPPQTIALRMRVSISPSFVGGALLATVRHELGHALGIWGHSNDINDALYFSQVAEPAPISPRDINTLKEIYQQPTRLGWKLPEKSGMNY